ncbi:30S ribosomal protein S1 [Thermogemmatispora carboxidivorans]|uniref:30S ribosomal protein S1 n=1 Tax=Thermogemmatispora carboxidivorans TaxID=1382306 RepID=UPI0009DD0867|nr:S1 RNA-binding domain-containing protein [Thermogemmatispora carboxidivorans]
MSEAREPETSRIGNPEESEDVNMEALLASANNPTSLKRGDVVEGEIVRIDQDEILVDIGLKSEGVLSTKELPASGYGSLNELKVHDKVLVYVVQPETPDGHAVLSLRKANAERQWRLVEEQYRNNELIRARVIDYNKGGLIVDVNGIRGFVPISQIQSLKREEVAAGGESQETAAKLASMKDKELQLKIIEINRARNRLILSERQAVQEWRQRRREELLDELKPGEIRKGRVSNLANFGAFVDLGGADGLVHISQLAWSRVNHPSEVLHVGQEVEVQVLSVDKEKKKIALSIKKAEVDPWTTVEQRYSPGQLVTGTITKIAPFGAFARIEDGIEGLIHLSELPPGMDPKTSLHEGQQLQLRILRIDPERRRLGLSLRQVEEPDSAKAQAQGQGQGPSQGQNQTAPSSGSAETTTRGTTDDKMKLSLEEVARRQESGQHQQEGRGERRERGEKGEREGRGERRERTEKSEPSLLDHLLLGDDGEITAMAEAFRAAALQRNKNLTTEETEGSGS